jgi:hypothetical protein
MPEACGFHLGHHFYGAGNLGDDFMVAGFLAAQREARGATLTGAVPFDAGPLGRRFPAIEWRSFTLAERERSVAECDLWLGLGGSPFQHAQSRWFLDHLMEEAALCRQYGKPMVYLGVGLQSESEAQAPEVRALAEQAAGIWTRDPQSADWLQAGARGRGWRRERIWRTGGFGRWRRRGRSRGVSRWWLILITGAWPGQNAMLAAAQEVTAKEWIWLAQESRELPGAEKTLYGALEDAARARWRLVEPDRPGEPLAAVMSGWPSGEWLVTARYHAALAGAWAGSKILVVGTNAKLTAAARELGAAVVAPDAGVEQVRRLLAEATPARPGQESAEAAWRATAAALRIGQRSNVAPSR